MISTTPLLKMSDILKIPQRLRVAKEQLSPSTKSILELETNLDKDVWEQAIRKCAESIVDEVCNRV